MVRYKKNPRQSKATVQVDGKSYPAKYIGRGQYSRVFRVGDRVVYYTHGDCGKEVLSMYLYNRRMHLPEIVRHDNLKVGQHIYFVFSMPYYRNVTPKDQSAWKLMKNIISLFNAYTKDVRRYEVKVPDIDYMQGFVNYLDGSGYLPHSVVKALQEIVDVASNCGSGVHFDFYKSNFGVNEYGVLIFRDPIYVKE